tara:strand:+ start:241 stop:1308 length:1068 start_codon:yes stop_codon:yes gene_type:complete
MSPDPALVGIAAETIPELLDDLEEYISGGNRAAALVKATEIVEKDPECVAALWALLELGLPERRRDGSYRIDPTLAEASKGWTLAKKIIALDPSHRGAWFRGAILATQHLGLSEEVLQWWEDFRVEFPTDTTPIIEQAALLIRMGFYAEASERLEVVVAYGMDEMPREQLFRVERMNQTIKRYYEMEKIDVFKPQNPDHSTWKDIDGMRNLKPGSEKFTFIMLAGPLVIWEALAIQMFMAGRDPQWYTMCAMFLLVYASILWVRRISITITDKRNRPVLDLWRAIEVEATSGKVCIPEKIREAKLYRTVMNKDYPVAFRRRMEKIVEYDEKISKRWEMKMPFWTTFDVPETNEEE